MEIDRNLNVVKMSRVRVTNTLGKDSSATYSTSKCTSLVGHSFWTVTLSLSVILLLVGSVTADDPVYIRSGAYMSSYGQLVTSSTLRWVKGQTKDSLKLLPEGHDEKDSRAVCRVWHTGLRGVGLISRDLHVCNISTLEGVEGSESFQTISSNAARLKWSVWTRPNNPPTGSVAISVKPQKFVAADLNKTMIGYLDPTVNLGSAMFPNDPEPTTTCLVLTEIEPVGYELSDVQLKRNKGFIEEEIVLAVGKLKYEASSDSDYVLTPKDPEESEESNDVKSSDEKTAKESVKGTIESILSYETNQYEYWGQGYLMAKGLHTSINLPDGSRRVIEWGIPLTQAGKTETWTAKEDLMPGTGVNVTLKGTRLSGEMSYWASLKTFFKDDTSSVRLIDGHRKVVEIRSIRLETSKPYFLTTGILVPDPTTTTPTTTPTTTSSTQPTSVPSDENGGSSSSDGSEESNGLPIENEIQSDQSQNLMADNMKSSSPAAKSVALSHATSNWKFHFSGFIFLPFFVILSHILSHY